MSDPLSHLNSEQQAAVTHRDGPLLIIAGAGTGKTTVITSRIAYLINNQLAADEEILALTFTEKAALEMSDRVGELLPFGYRDLWISTFHGFGERLLKQHGLEIGLPGDFRLLNEFEQWALVRKNLDRFSLDFYRPLGNPTKFIHALIKHFSRAKDENISPADYFHCAQEAQEDLDACLGGGSKKGRKKGAALDPDRTAREQETARRAEVANAYHIYQQLLLENNALDFGDLINYSLKLLRDRPAWLNHYRRQFKYILVDEFQDTNWAQYELVKLLAAPANNLAVVGDDDQSIYKFRGASVANILQFKKDFLKARQIALTKNYRNCQNILDLAYDFIQHNNPNRLECQLEKDRGAGGPALSKKLHSQRPDAGRIELLQGADRAGEVSLVMEKIAALKAEGRAGSWNDFAVLVRANDSARDFCQAFAAAGWPFQLFSSRGLYEKPVIIDLISYLKLLDNYHESSALFRVLNWPFWGFGWEEIANFSHLAGKKAWSLYEVLRQAGRLGLPAPLVDKAGKLLGLVEKHAAFARSRSAAEVAVAVLNETGYLAHLVGQAEQVARENLSYLNQFLDRIKDFTSVSGRTALSDFLVEYALELESGETGALSPDPEAGPDLIRVMTAHMAKGLEFKYVFLPNLVDKRFPTVERSEPIELPSALVKEILLSGDFHLEEERRLFYVALTRARDGVFFSWAPDYGGLRPKQPSRFLYEAGILQETPAIVRPPRDRLAAFAPAAVLAPSSPSGPRLPAPAYYSFTQLAAFDNCPYQYRFAHILKIPRPGKFVFSYGQTMHLALEKIFALVREKQGLGQKDLFGAPPPAQAKELLSWEEVDNIYKASWQDDWYESAAQKEEFRRKGRACLKDFFARHRRQWPEAIALEQGVNFRLAGHRFYGKIDRLDKQGPGLRIVDYKTGQPKSGGRLSPEDKQQLLLYQLAARQTYSQPIVNLRFYYLDDNSEADFLGTDEALAAAEKSFLGKIKKIEAACATNDFSPHPGPLCRYCDFFHICEHRAS